MKTRYYREYASMDTGFSYYFSFMFSKCWGEPPSLFFITVLVILINFLYQETKILHPQVLFEIIF